MTVIEKACTRCKIYFPNANALYSCPICYTPLENIKDSDGYVPKKWDPNTNEVTDINTPHSRTKNNDTAASPNTRQNNSHVPSPSVASFPASSGRAYAGTIINYVRNDVGQQSFSERVSLFFRGMHHGNTQHIITFVDEGDNNTYKVCYYGEYSAVGSAIPQAGEHISIGGRPSGSTFESENVYIGDGSRQKIRLRNQYPPGHRTNPIPGFIVIAVLVGLFFLAKVVMTGGFDYLGRIIETYLISTAVIFFLGLIFLSRRIRFRTLGIGSLILGGIATAFICNIGGVTTRYSDDIQVILATVLILGAMIAGVITMIRGSFR